jgi:alpha-methylacyl-CoA racemase
MRARDEWVAIFEGTDACVSAALAPHAVLELPHVAARGIFVEDGGVLQPAPAPRFVGTPVQLRLRHSAPTAVRSCRNSVWPRRTSTRSSTRV